MSRAVPARVAVAATSGLLDRREAQGAARAPRGASRAPRGASRGRLAIQALGAAGPRVRAVLEG